MSICLSWVNEVGYLKLTKGFAGAILVGKVLERYSKIRFAGIFNELNNYSLKITAKLRPRPHEDDCKRKR